MVFPNFGIHPTMMKNPKELDAFRTAEFGEASEVDVDLLVPVRESEK